MSETTAFPLCWPFGWPRTRLRASARYSVTPDAARRHLVDQLRLMGARNVVLSSNVALRRDGQPYADGMRRIDDPGVAAYFDRKGQTQVIACDKWANVGDNFRAIGLTVEALRGIDRAGASELLDRAFTGFKALPPAGATIASNGPPWWEVLACDPRDSPLVVKERYRTLARQYHPDAGGDAGAMAAINRAWEQAQASREVAP